MRCAAPLAVFCALAVAVAVHGDGPLGGWDDDVVQFLAGHWRSWPLHTALRISIHAGHTAALVGAAAAVAAALALARRWADAGFVAAAAGVAVLVPLLKLGFARPAPAPEAGELSFPSGHAALTIAVVTAFVAVAPAVARPAVALLGGFFVAVVGCAVVTAMGHWPTDVLAGWALGLAWLGALDLLRRRARGLTFLPRSPFIARQWEGGPPH